jgi:septal ring factor EnvC (AmiA/AmiB activator)
VIAEVLAALQRIGRRPPPAIMARPEDALQSVRTAILLGAVLPEMRQRAQTLAADLSELVRIRDGNRRRENPFDRGSWCIGGRAPAHERPDRRTKEKAG